MTKDPLTWGPDDPRISYRSTKNVYDFIQNFIILYTGLTDVRNIHRYVYVFNNPTGYLDPRGLHVLTADDYNLSGINSTVRGVGATWVEPVSPANTSPNPFVIEGPLSNTIDPYGKITKPNPAEALLEPLINAIQDFLKEEKTDVPEPIKDPQPGISPPDLTDRLNKALTKEGLK